ncbi:MAG TPA: TlpA disulfide reductase family protein [Gammaproteobacteria bacterium]|jgi:thiol-disulfide isomerase/thioredoxin|nr:TlpA disulfide reductase family protein [Gammaproteobacteria bacterium]
MRLHRFLLTALLATAAAHADAPAFGLAQYQGKLVYLDFWASWCKPCRQSFPWMDAMQKKYAADGLVIVAVDEDEQPADGQKFLAVEQPGFAIVGDPKGGLAERYALLGMPSSFLIGRDGQVLQKHAGFYTDSPAQFEAEIRAALGKEQE